MNDQPFQKPPVLTPYEQERLNQLRSALDLARVEYAILANADTVNSAEEGVLQGVGTLEEMAPTFLLKSENGWICAIVSGQSRLSYKKIKKQLGLKNVSLARPEEVEQVTGAAIGSVALVNPGLMTIVDCRLIPLDAVYGGCGVPRHTLKISVRDLLAVSKAQVFDFTDLK